ncbi:TonB family protein [Hyalangium gracile]|uniref:TonB family protein n=1 Tax=Hyalangium gracile TaxID=394092 RepID=UPI001CCD2FA3|nr:TonB family protein [Hyalangium gracile]
MGDVASSSVAAPGNGGGGGKAIGDLKDYARRLASRVALQRRYPANAVRLGMEGTAHVQLRVRGDGTLLEPPRLVRSAGQEVLDVEALRMVEAAAPFEPMPESASRPHAAFVIPVVFSLRSGN